MAVNTNSIQYAFRVVTDYATDIPDIGLYNGEIRFITGRETTGFTFEDTTSADGFLTGFLIDDCLRSVGAKIDISTGGNFNSLNTCTVTIDNTSSYYQNMVSNEIYLTNSKAYIYVVVNGVMYSRFAGVINRTTYNEKYLVFEIKDYNELNFKQLPENETEQVLLGDSAYVKAKEYSSSYDIIGSYYGYRYMRMDDDNSYWLHLVGDIQGDISKMYLRPRKASDPVKSDSFDNLIRLLDSDNGAFTSFQNGKEVSFVTTKVKLSRQIPDIIDTNGGVDSNMVDGYDIVLDNESTVVADGNPERTTYVFDLIYVEKTYVVSSMLDSDAELDADGKPILYSYDSDNKTYNRLYIDSRIGYGQGNMYLTTNSAIVNTGVTEYEVIKPDKIEYRTITSEVLSSSTPESKKASQWIVSEGVIPVDVDFKSSGGFGVQWAERGTQIKLFYSDFDYDKYDAVYLGSEWQFKNYQTDDLSELDFDDAFNFSTHNIGTIDYSIDGVSYRKEMLSNPASNTCDYILVNSEEPKEYTNLYSDNINSKISIRPTSESFESGVNYVFGNYYNNLSPVVFEGSMLGGIEQDTKAISKLESNPITTDSNGNSVVCISAGLDYEKYADTKSIGMTIYDMFLVVESKKEVSEVFVKLKSSGTGENNSGTVYGAFKNLLEGKNNFTPNYGNLASRRSHWDCSRVLSDSKSSKEYIKELAKQSFVGVYTNRLGLIELDAFLEPNTNRTTLIHDNETVTEDSITNVSTTNPSRVYNDITLKYNFDYGASEYTNGYSVTSIDQSAFPTYGDDYSEYSTIPDYDEARSFWESCHTTYERNRVLNALPSDLSECKWYRDLQEYDTNNSGVMASSVHYYMKSLVQWVTASKNTLSYHIPINSENIKIELLDRVMFRDYLVTGDTYIDGWVTGYELIPQQGNKGCKIKVEITTIPREIVPVYSVIDEKPSTDNTIDESSVTVDAINEQFDIWS